MDTFTEYGEKTFTDCQSKIENVAGAEASIPETMAADLSMIDVSVEMLAAPPAVSSAFQPQQNFSNCAGEEPMDIDMDMTFEKPSSPPPLEVNDINKEKTENLSFELSSVDNFQCDLTTTDRGAGGDHVFNIEEDNNKIVSPPTKIKEDQINLKSNEMEPVQLMDLNSTYTEPTKHSESDKENANEAAVGVESSKATNPDSKTEEEVIPDKVLINQSIMNRTLDMEKTMDITNAKNVDALIPDNERECPGDGNDDVDVNCNKIALKNEICTETEAKSASVVQAEDQQTEATEEEKMEANTNSTLIIGNTTTDSSNSDMQTKNIINEIASTIVAGGDENSNFIASPTPLLSPKVDTMRPAEDSGNPIPEITAESTGGGKKVISVPTVIQKRPSIHAYRDSKTESPKGLQKEEAPTKHQSPEMVVVHKKDNPIELFDVCGSDFAQQKEYNINEDEFKSGNPNRK